MDSSARNELNSIIQELSSIIKELEEISQGVRYDFKNIGSEKCADCIDRVLSKYYTAKQKLNNIDTTTVTESFAQAHGGGGGSHGGGSR